MPSPNIWLERYRRRFDWATAAYDQFLKELMPELTGQIPSSDNITVVVYGATQVGKTTLILDLLGLSTRTSDEAANVLRGGQQLGKSATATPIRYRRSENNDWYIGNIGPLSADEARQRLGDIRNKVQGGYIHDAEVLDICIPSKLFLAAEGEPLNLNLNIVDIPGINSHSKDEQLLVSNLARKYVSTADLVLLVGRADSLGFLNAEDLQIEALAEWAAQPVRFRIVLTFSFSPDSLCRKFENQELPMDVVRDEIISEMRTHDYKFPDDFRSNLFPLEMGDSIAELAQSNPKYHQQIMEVTTCFREQLLHDIKLATGPYTRLYGAFQLDRVIRARITAMRYEYDKELSGIEQKRKIAFQPLKVWGIDEGDEAAVRNENCAVKAKLLKLTDQKRELAGCLKQLDIAFFLKRFKIIKKEVSARKVSCLQEQLNGYNAELKKICETVTNNIISDWFDQELPVVTFSPNQLWSISERLEDYNNGWLGLFQLDAYVSSSNFETDQHDLLAAVSRCAEEHASKAYCVVKSSLEKAQESLSKEIGQQQYKLQTFEHSLQLLDKCRTEQQETRSRLARSLWEMRDSLRLVNHFESQLNISFLSELELASKKIYKRGNAVEQFYGLLQSKMLTSEIEKMYSGRNF